MNENDIEMEEPGGSPEILTCVEYPGKVENVDKMIETLGGLKKISSTMAHPNLRLELRFRPNDVFSKPTCAERSEQSGFVLKVKRFRKKKKNPNDPDEFKIEHDIVGIVDSSYQFNSMCDFQFLPMQKKKDNSEEYESIYDQIFFDKLVDTSWFINENRHKVPLFIPPAAFSRMDIPQEYQYRREAASEKLDLTTPYNIIGRTRQRRSHHAIFVPFELDQVPEKPRDYALNQLKMKFISDQDLTLIKKKYEEQPIWTKNALVSQTNVLREKIKYILPALAYYFITGPWRNQWVRYGYDPRKDNASGKYQTLDYRVRLQGGAKNKIKAKRSYINYVLPYKAVNLSKSKTSSILDKTSIASPNEKKSKSIVEDTEEKELERDIYLFRPGRMPPYRQMFYQFLHIEFEPAQKLITSNFQPEGPCDEKNGWYKVGTDQSLRELLTSCINSTLNQSDPQDVEDEESIAVEDEEEDDDSGSSDYD